MLEVFKKYRSEFHNRYKSYSLFNLTEKMTVTCKRQKYFASIDVYLVCAKCFVVKEILFYQRFCLVHQASSQCHQFILLFRFNSNNGFFFIIPSKHNVIDLLGHHFLQYRGSQCCVFKNKMKKTLTIHGTPIAGTHFRFDAFKKDSSSGIVIKAFIQPFNRKQHIYLLAVCIYGNRAIFQHNKPGGKFGFFGVGVCFFNEFTRSRQRVLRRGEQRCQQKEYKNLFHAIVLRLN